MTLKDSIEFLVNNNYLVVLEGDVRITSKLYKALSIKKVVEEPVMTVAHATELIKTPSEVVKSIKSVKKLTDAELRAVWNKFVEDTGIPWKVTTPQGAVYTIRHFGPTAAAHLHKVISSTDVDYNTLVEATKSYYRNVTKGCTF